MLGKLRTAICLKALKKKSDSFIITSWRLYNHLDNTHGEFLLRNGVGKTFLWKNIFCSMNVNKSRGKRIFEIVHWPFQLPPN